MPLLANIEKIGISSYRSKSGRYHIYQPYEGLPEENNPNRVEHWIVVDNLDGGRYLFPTLRSIKQWLLENNLDQ